MTDSDLVLSGLPPGPRDILYHFSEDPDIKEFRPRRSRPLPGHPDGRDRVWAIDQYHAPRTSFHVSVLGSFSGRWGNPPRPISIAGWAARAASWPRLSKSVGYQSLSLAFFTVTRSTPLGLRTSEMEAGTFLLKRYDRLR